MKNFRAIFAKQGLFFILTFLGLVVINFLWLIPTIQSSRSSASIFALTVAERINSEINLSLEQVLIEANEAGEQVAEAPDKQERILARLLDHHPIFTSAVVVNRRGKGILLSNGDASNPNLQGDFSKNPSLYLAFQGSSEFSPPFVGTNSEPHATIAVPIRQADGTINEVIIAEINLQHLISIIRSPKIGNGHAYIVDRDGFQILHPNILETLRRKNFSQRAIVNKVLIDGHIADGLSPDDSYINENGESTFVVGLPIPIPRWALFVEQPRTQALAEERRAIFIAIGTVILAVFIFIFIVRSTLRLQFLTAVQAELLAENDRSAKLLVQRDIELTSANVRLQELDRTKSEFVSVAAHQLRTPLTGLRWSYNALLDGEMGPLNDEQKSLVIDSLKAALQMITLINDLLNVARIEEGRFGFNFKTQSLLPVLERSTKRIEKPTAEKGILFSLSMPEKPLPPLSLDEEKIAIMFDNLLDNAIKYTPPGGKITLAISQEEDHVTILVTDTGIGIPKNQMKKLFTKFFRADNAVLFQTSGNGLGLYVVKNIVETHDGSISVHSEESKGTSFTITIPIRNK